MATINAARVLRVEDRLGSISEGKTADLILVGHNPMTDPQYLRQPLAVVKNGQWLGKNELDMLDEAASNPSNTYFTMGRVLEFLIH
jgi:imidazolonepropionase-like amidohydrolase